MHLSTVSSQLKVTNNLSIFRCDEENDEDDEIDTTLICEQYTKEYEEQLELATTTENKIETKVRSRIGIHDYVSTI